MNVSPADAVKMRALQKWAAQDPTVNLQRLKASDLEKARDATGVSPVDVERLAYAASTWDGHVDAPSNALDGASASNDPVAQGEVFPVSTADTNPQDAVLRDLIGCAEQSGWSFAVDRTLMFDKPITGQRVLDESRNGHTVVARRTREGYTVASSDGGAVHYKDKQKETFGAFAKLEQFLGGFESIRNVPASALPQATVALEGDQLQRVLGGLWDTATNLHSHTEDAEGKVYVSREVKTARALFAQVPATAKAGALAGVARLNPDLAADLGGLTQLRFHEAQHFANRGLADAATFADPAALSHGDVSLIQRVIDGLADKLPTRGNDGRGAVYQPGSVLAARTLFVQLSAADRLVTIASIAGKNADLAADLSGQQSMRLDW